MRISDFEKDWFFCSTPVHFCSEKCCSLKQSRGDTRDEPSFSAPQFPDSVGFFVWDIIPRFAKAPVADIESLCLAANTSAVAAQL
jgi:hypothetical protein